MLRAATKRDIFATLDATYFGASNFTTDYGDGEAFLVRITFIPETSFSFLIEKLNSNSYKTTEAPGINFIKPERHIGVTLEGAIILIPKWVQRVKEEVIDSNPLFRELQSVRKQLEERIDILAERQEEYFTRQESEELVERLQEFTNRLESLAHENSAMRETIENLKSQLAELAAATGEVNKGTWFRMASSKLFSTAKAVVGSKEGRELALEAAKKLLLED